MKLFRYFVSGIVTMTILASCSGISEDGGNIELLPVKLTEDGNWSMVNSDGAIVYEDEFKNAPSAAYEGVFSVLEGDLYTLYKTGEKNPVPLKDCEGLKSVGTMSDGLIPVAFSGGRIQLRDKDGNKICDLGPIDGVEVISCGGNFSEGLLKVYVQDGDQRKGGFVNKRGEVVIKPQYTVVSEFHDGVAICGNNDGELESEIYVIDRDGKILFKMDEDYFPADHFIDGQLIISNEESDGIYFLDKKGKRTKLPSKLNRLHGFNGKYIGFESSDGEYGVADMKGEIFIRPKYCSLDFGWNDKFLAKKSGKDEMYVLNAKGDVVETLDYSAVYKLGAFGYSAKDGKKWILLDKNFKQLGENEYYEISEPHPRAEVISEYFDAEGVADLISERISKDGFDNIRFGMTAAEFMNGKPAPEGYTPQPLYTSKLISGFRYAVVGGVWFSQSPATWKDGEWQWCSDAKLKEIRLGVVIPNEGLEEVFDLLRKRVGKAGLSECDTRELENGEVRTVMFNQSGSSSDDTLVAIMKEGDFIWIDLYPEKLATVED